MNVEPARALTEGEVEELRAGIPALRHSTYLNTAAVAPSHCTVTDTLVETYKWIGEHGYITPDVHAQLLGRVREVRAQVAGFVGADPDEIVFLRNTTEGLNTIARGFTWQVGDEVILSNQENPAALLPYANLARRCGVTIRRLQLTDDASRVLSDLTSLLTPRTRLIVLSHVTHNTGLLLPFEEICSLGRRVGVPILWDGAQALGQVPVDFHQSGCDFYSGCSYKWLLGPFGAGILYIRRDWLKCLEVVDIGVGSQESLDLETLDFTLKGTAQRHEYGSYPWPLYLGLGAAVRLLSGIGIRTIRRQILQLADYAREGLATIPKVVVVSSANPVHMSGILTIAVPRIDAQEVRRSLWEEYRVQTQFRHLPVGAPAHQGIRFSLAVFTTRQEIDYALESLRKVLG